MTEPNQIQPNYYAKPRKVQFLKQYKGIKTTWILEIRNISHLAEIESEILPEHFDTKVEAEQFAKSKGYQVTRTWSRAEQRENIYRDGSQNIYRSREFAHVDKNSDTGISTEDQNEINRRFEALQLKQGAVPPDNKSGISLFD